MFNKDINMYVLELRGLSKGEHPPAKAIEHPTWIQIEKAVTTTFALGGWVSLDVVRPRDAYFKRICMYANPGQFRVIALTRDEDPKMELLEWWHPENESFLGMIRFGDDDWDSRTVGNSVDLAIEIFHDLHETGRLSTAALENFRSQWNPKPK